MDGLENLNFQVILDHKDFDREVEKVKEMARGLNKEVSKALDLKQKVASSNAKIAVDEEKIKQATAKTAQEQEKVNTQKAKTRVEEQKIANLTTKTQAAQRGVTGAVQQTNTTLVTTSSLMRTLSALTGTAFSVVGIRRFLSSLIEVTGQFEVQKMALRNMLQDIDAADKIYQDLYRFSSESTYRFSELAKYAKQLAAFNIPKEDLLETTKMLGDVASGVGVSMDRIILAYGHVKSSGFLRGIQLRSFAQNGVPVLEELAKQFSEIEKRTVSLGEIFDKMMRREIPFEMVEESFRRMTSEGGKFYQMQEVLAKTLAGQINILKGRWENLLAAMGESNQGILKGTVKSLSDMISSTEKFSQVIKQAVIAIGAYETSLIIAALATGNMAVASTGLAGALGRVVAAVAKNPWVLLAAGVAALAVQIYKTRNAISDLEKINLVAEKSINDFDSAIKSEIGELDALYAKLRYAKKGTDEYNSAKLAIQSRFGSYIQELRAEGKEVDDLGKLYDNLAAKIKNATAQRFRESATQDITKTYGDTTGKIEGYFKQVLSSMEKALGRELTEMEKEGLWQRMTGGINDSNIAEWAKLQPGLRSAMSKINTDVSLVSKAFEIAGLQMSHSGTTNHAILGALGTAWKKASDIYANSMTRATDAFNKFVEGQVEGSDETKDRVVYNIASIVAGIKKYDADIKRLRDKAKSEGLVVDKEKGIDEKQDLANYITARKEQTDLYKEIMGVDYDKDTKNATKEAISDLKSQIRNMEQLYVKYKGYQQKMGEDKAGEFMAKNIGGKAEDYDKLESKIKELIADLRALGAEGEDAAREIENRLGIDALSVAEKQFDADAKAAKEADKALKKYIETLEKMERKSGDTKNQGVAHKVANAIEKYKDKIADAEKQYGVGVDALKKSGAEDPMSKELKLRFAMWDLWGTAANDLRNDLEGLADEVFKLAMNGYDLTDWGDKSLAQVLKIEKALKKIELPEEVKALLTPEQQARMTKLVKGLASAFLEETVDPEKLKKIGEEIKEIASEVEGLIGSAEELAEVANPAMAEGLRAMKEMADVGGRIVEKLLKKDWISAVAIGVGWIGQKIIENVTATKRWEQELKAARAELEHFRLLDYLEGTDSILGDDSLDKFQRAMSTRALLVANFNRQLAKYNMTWKDLQARSEFFNADGTMNTDAMSAAMKIDGAEAAATWDYIISHAEEYNEALQIIRETQEEVIGGIAASAADQIVEGWIAAGDAALDYADILDDVARKYAKMVVEQMIMDAIGGEGLVEDLARLMAQGDTEGYMAKIAEAMQIIKDMSPELAAALQGFDPYFNRDDEESGSLGKGIKSITEETASLLASYLNAIRADVSYMRSMAESGWLKIESIAGVVTPKLADYVQQIAANTANNAKSTAEILSRLNDVIGTPDTDGMVVRVQQM